ncbi:hypothetical protein ACFL0H_07685 [Thermodesulfobacteriota bacterium]
MDNKVKGYDTLGWDLGPKQLILGNFDFNGKIELAFRLGISDRNHRPTQTCHKRIWSSSRCSS